MSEHMNSDMELEHFDVLEVFKTFIKIVNQSTF
jgi:hypothetical protein